METLQVSIYYHLSVSHNLTLWPPQGKLSGSTTEREGEEHATQYCV